MAISWRAKRQLFFLAVFIVLIFLIVFGVIYLIRPAPSCFDNKQNQDEEGIDCGGSCKSCLTKGDDFITLWTRFFETGRGEYEAAAFIENPNLLLGTGELVYRFRLYDANNILIALREGRTFVNPREKLLIFEKGIQTLERVPARITIEFPNKDLIRIEEERPQIVVTQKSFENTPSGARVRAIVRNQSLFPVDGISLAVALLDSRGNAFGVSTARLANLPGESEREVFFTWPEQFETPVTIEVVARTDLTK